jgi:hypothetical protein
MWQLKEMAQVKQSCNINELDKAWKDDGAPKAMVPLCRSQAEQNSTVYTKLMQTVGYALVYANANDFVLASGHSFLANINTTPEFWGGLV